MNKEIEKIIVDTINHELDLPLDYGKDSKGNVIPCVTIYAQNIKLFNTDKLQITVKTLSTQDYSNRTLTKEIDGEFFEIQDINQSRMMQIDVYSRNNEARQRFWEVSAALNSTYAQRQTDLYNFKIGTISRGVNLSGLDGGSDINRYTITFNVLIHYQKQKPIDYYDTFPLELNTEHEEIIIKGE